MKWCREPLGGVCASGMELPALPWLGRFFLVWCGCAVFFDDGDHVGFSGYADGVSGIVLMVLLRLLGRMGFN